MEKFRLEGESRNSFIAILQRTSNAIFPLIEGNGQADFDSREKIWHDLCEAAALHLGPSFCLSGNFSVLDTVLLPRMEYSTMRYRLPRMEAIYRF